MWWEKHFKTEKVMNLVISCPFERSMLFCIIYLYCQCNNCINPVTATWNFLGNSVVEASLSCTGVQVWSLAGQLGSHMPHNQKNQNIKQKQYCNKFSTYLKNGSHQKKKNFNKKNNSYNSKLTLLRNNSQKYSIRDNLFNQLYQNFPQQAVENS